MQRRERPQAVTAASLIYHRPTPEPPGFPRYERPLGLNPEDLVGRQVCFIANLPPRKLKGIESQGMILSAVNKDGSLVLISPSAPTAPGAKIG